MLFLDERYQDINAKTIDAWVADGWEWGVPIRPEVFAKARAGEWDVVLTPTKPVPKEWFAPFFQDGRLTGARILGLASGGGQQMPVFAAAGAVCTVLDYSEKQLESERMVAAREGYDIEIVRADMTQPLPFADGSFDLIFHPISNCYVEDVLPIWRECYRVLRKGGVLLAGMDNGIDYLTEEANPLLVVNKLPYNPLKNPALLEKGLREDDGVQFSHTLEDQIGGQLKAGLTLTDVYEDTSPGWLLGDYYPMYWASRAVKMG